MPHCPQFADFNSKLGARMHHSPEIFRFELNEESGHICAKGPNFFSKNGKFLFQGIVKMLSLFEPLELALLYRIRFQSTWPNFNLSLLTNSLG